MKAAIEVALGQARSAESYRETLVTLGERCDRLTSMVNGLLLLARADAGEVELRREPVDLSSIAAEVAEMFEPLAEERGIALGLDAPTPVIVQGDPTRLAQLATNLVDNAIKFTEEGRAVAVQVDRRAGRARLVVSDGGVGITADRLPHVFERFSQADPARSSKGSGLGLNICRWIVEAHGGTIRAESEPGLGSRFAAEFPMAESPREGSTVHRAV
jgi:signal transduction histidine kinase